MSEVLVTGATGFVGSHLVEALLRSGKAVVCLVRPGRDALHLERPGIRIHPGDLLDGESLRGCCDGVETVFHLGACANLRTRNARSLRANTAGTRNLLKEVGRSGGVGRLLYMSSLTAAGRPPGERVSRPLDDRCGGVPDTPYGRSKCEAERTVRSGCEGAGIAYVILRPALVYGPGSRPDAGMNALMRAVATGSLASRFDLPGRLSVVYVKDLVRACLIVAEHPEAVNRTFFVSDGPPVTFGEIFQTVRRLLGRRRTSHRLSEGACRAAGSAYDCLDRLFGVSGLIPPYLLAPVSANLACESSALQQQLGYRAHYPLSLGLAETLRIQKCA